MEALSLFVKNINEEAVDNIKYIKDVLYMKRSISILGIAGTVFIGIIGIVFMTKSLSRSLKILILGTKEIAKGNLNARIKIDEKGEIGELADSFNSMAEKLRLSGEQIQSIVDSMPMMLVGIGSNGMIGLINKTASKQTGCLQSDVADKTFHDIYPQFKSIEEESLLFKRETVDINGRKEYYDIMIYPLSGGLDIKKIILIRDVTEAVRMEERMLQSEKMLSVGGLAAGMAHEINNPVGIILQSVQNMDRRLGPGLAKNQTIASELGLDLEALQAYLNQRSINSYLAAIKEAGVRTANIVKLMLNFSRQSESVKASHDYNLNKKYDFKSILVKKDYGTIPQIMCIDTEISLAFLNLIKNAAQALTRSEQIGGDQPVISLKTREFHNSVTIHIKDNGHGIDGENLKKIFDPFHTTKPPGEGTGLGLSITYFIITTHHNGSIDVHSRPGHGTCFVIVLPIN